uniref:Uncharacterized protein n=1 Tax=Heterorhabditis bacteriophora TaxID=37862 RepID=A0A1I7WAJ6_HETBA
MAAGAPLAWERAGVQFPIPPDTFLSLASRTHCKGICVTFMLRVFGCKRYGVGNQVIRLTTNI